jgi:hypothetical protein
VRQTYKPIFFVVAVIIASITITSNTYASDKDCKFGEGNCGPGSCYSRGVEDGKNNNFGDYFKIDPSKDCDAGEFLPRYTEGFIDGCIDADNTRETCERFTDGKS